ncbi:hypothetical protein CKO42_22710 [Lamprobacter modestohalophilus]|uniref:Uncharacterized protein n=1 Tax=Lamprobacter modestohalophilus TaxID=1064514 RepID=A0A9X0WD28_9GAMM|nr:DUF6746 family protein [Lamprobacter modestohalophilus]MBK1621176.1 hypothetical protein [Lamprobacter modestohalophilus]MCF7994600.1 hypothetical protein [Chromatiaceae bacterium]MCF8014839.1 hypothetical protein [Chromatiaceae bacterium]
MTMKSTPITLALFLTVSGSVAADELSPDGRPHFSGKDADSVKEAFHHFEEGNEKLEKYLKGDSIEGADLAHVHELTYTLENAIAKMQAALARLATSLEEVHLASERGDADVVLESGREYLSIADQFDD